MSQISPKTYNQILSEFIGETMANTPITDIQAGSVLTTLMNMVADTTKRNDLHKFLCKLDSRFRIGHQFQELAVAQRYYSKL
jgi:hypothetical protein